MITTRFVVYYVLLVVLNFSLGFSPILHRSPNTGKILGNARLPVKSVSLCAKLENELVGNEEKIGKIQSVAAKSMMIAYIVSMCVALPLAMAPPAILHKFNIIKKARREHYSARLGQFCARWLMRVFPFANVSVIPASDGKQEEDPSVWVCNHTSMLDIFFLMAMSKKLRYVINIFVSMLCIFTTGLLISLHNIYFYQQFMREIRKNIKNGTFLNFHKKYINLFN